MDGAGAGFTDKGDLESSATALRTDEGTAQGLESALTAAQGAVGSFFVDGAGSAFASESDLQSAATALRSDESAAEGLEDALVAAQDDVNAFFGADGPAGPFANSTEIGDEIAALTTLKSEAEGLEGAYSSPGCCRQLLQMAQALGLQTREILESSATALRTDEGTAQSRECSRSCSGWCRYTSG